MITGDNNFQLIINRIPVVGILSFGLLSYYSTTLYPGGSQANINTIGFDWVNNYWCNLMSEKGINGAKNPARPFAIFAMIILCSSLSVVFYQFADFWTRSKIWRIAIKLSGTLSMIFSSIMFSKYHDLMTIVASLFGLIALIGIVQRISRSNLWIYKISGIICLLLLGLNNIVYYSSHFIESLPLLQKVTFFVVLIWVLGLNFETRKRILVR